MLRFSILLLALLAALPVGAQTAYSPQMMEWTSRAGRMLHSYQAALHLAEAAVKERSGSDSLPPLFAGGPYDDGWAFSFGALEQDSIFVIRYGVITSGSGTVVRFEEFRQRRVASAHHTRAARALARVMDDFDAIRGEQGFTAAGYRFAVLPFPGAGLTAFVSPAQAGRPLTLFGNDLMYSISRSDGSISGRTRFHRRVIELPTEAPANAVAALMVPEAPGPSPVDVAHVIERGAPLIVIARAAFMIDAQGSVSVLPEDDPRVRAARTALEQDR